MTSDPLIDSFTHQITRLKDENLELLRELRLSNAEKLRLISSLSRMIHLIAEESNP